MHHIKYEMWKSAARFFIWIIGSHTQFSWFWAYHSALFIGDCWLKLERNNFVAAKFSTFQTFFSGYLDKNSSTFQPSFTSVSHNIQKIYQFEPSSAAVTLSSVYSFMFWCIFVLVLLTNLLYLILKK